MIEPWLVFPQLQWLRTTWSVGMHVFLFLFSASHLFVHETEILLSGTAWLHQKGSFSEWGQAIVVSASGHRIQDSFCVGPDH